MGRVGFEHPQLTVTDGFEDDTGQPHRKAGPSDGEQRSRCRSDDRRELQRQRDEPARHTLHQEDFADDLADRGAAQEVGVARIFALARRSAVDVPAEP